MGLPTHPLPTTPPTAEQLAKMSSPPPPPIDDPEARAFAPLPPLDPENQALLAEKAESQEVTKPASGLLSRVIGRFTGLHESRENDPSRDEGRGR